jgi:hypothetical protein
MPYTAACARKEIRVHDRKREHIGIHQTLANLSPTCAAVSGKKNATGGPGKDIGSRNAE